MSKDDRALIERMDVTPAHRTPDSTRLTNVILYLALTALLAIILAAFIVGHP
ncbi:MAG: hypothetical protein H0U60_18600 [Blastocatellia bacterium]|nr:hypothetical protein [Blastocatellia bacterium]